MSPLKRISHPEQRPLNLFIEGLPAPAPPEDSLSAIEVMTYQKTGYRRYPDKLPHDEVAKTVLRLHGYHVVVCPKCLLDVEPAPDIQGDVTFCQCPKCKNYYFVFELVNDRSLRIVTKGEDISLYYLYADGNIIADAYQDRVFEYRREEDFY